MSNKKWGYTHSDHSRHGRMVCSQCSQLIFGEYRYRDAGDKYITEHRSCSTEDRMWARVDKEREQERERCRVRLEAFKAFRDQWAWKDDAFEHEIEYLEQAVNS